MVSRPTHAGQVKRALDKNGDHYFLKAVKGKAGRLVWRQVSEAQWFVNKSGSGSSPYRARPVSKRQQMLRESIYPETGLSAGARHYIQNPKTGTWKLSPTAVRKGTTQRQLYLERVLTNSGKSPRGRQYRFVDKRWRLEKSPGGGNPRRKGYSYPKGVASGYVLDRSGGKQFRYGHYNYIKKDGRQARRIGWRRL